MKTKISVGLAIAVALMLAACTALALTQMEELEAVWQDSFRRMHTTGTFEAVERDQFDLDAFEKEYQERTGIAKKLDLVISTVPQEGGLCYAEAYQIARSAIVEQFATPAAELDAMGVYPSFCQTVYTDELSEWEFYFTPRQNENIDDDHAYPGPGEYRVYIQSPAGEVTFCHWYNDDFWPAYARRTWEAGKKEYVYQRASEPAFYQQSLADQQAFITLFEEEGLDVRPFQETDSVAQLSSIYLELMFAEPDQNLLHADDLFVTVACRAMEEKYGLTVEMLDRCCFCALPSPLESETTDVCFAFNFRMQEQRMNDGANGLVENSAIDYAKRLGLYRVCIDSSTLQVREIVYAPAIPDTTQALDPSLLLGRRNWTANDLPEFERLRGELRALDEQMRLGELEYAQAWGRKDGVMREYGGDPLIYSRKGDLAPDILPKEKALEIALQYVAEQRGMSVEEAAARYTRQTVSYTEVMKQKWVECWECRISAEEDSWRVMVSIEDETPFPM